MKGLSGLSEKFMPIFKTLITELSELSWIAAIAMIALGGILYIFGNEFGAAKLCRKAVIGYFIIQLAAMLC